MNSGDITRVIIIILIFVVLYVINVLSVGIENIKRNWPKYRCNPTIMPFAGVFGHNSAENFTYCMQTIQTNYMGYLTQPLNYNINVLGNIGSVLNDAINSIRAFFAYLRDMITEIIQNVFGVFLNILIEFQKMTVAIKDMFSKFIGILATMMYMLSGSMQTIQSTWNGPAGQLVRTVGDIAGDL
jgi:hypothetical protein